MQTFPFFIFSKILFIEYAKIIIAKIDISNPLKGSNDNVAALTPNIAKIPTPHAAHPGARTPIKIPIDARIPIFLSSDFIIFILYKIKLNNIPKRMLIKIMLICELSLIVFPKPLVNEINIFSVLKKPDEENVEINNLQFFIAAFNE